MIDESLIMEIWDTFKEYIPEKSKSPAADQYIDFLIGKEVDNDTLESYIGYDNHLDDAIRAVIDNDDPISDSDQEDDYEEDDGEY